MKCAKCDKEATKRFSPDLDIRGIGACDEHEEIVKVGYLALLQGDEKLAKSLLKAAPNLTK